MKRSYLLAALLLAGMISTPVSEASAERVKQNSAKADKAFEKCENNGAVTVESGGVSSCIDRTGHGIVCGGPKPDHKGTCDTFRRSGKTPKRLTNAELMRTKAAAGHPGH